MYMPVQENINPQTGYNDLLSDTESDRRDSHFPKSEMEFLGRKELHAKILAMTRNRNGRGRERERERNA